MAIAAAGVAAFVDDEARSGSDPEAAERGRMIYARGVSGSGDEITVSVDLFGDTGTTFSASRYACLNCHGAEGVQSIEGGVPVPGIQAHQLASPLNPGNGTGRNRVAYDESTLRRAITMGVDSSGNNLNLLMPRFNVSDHDLSDLLAYVEKLGRDEVPGVSDQEIRIASILDHDAVGEAVTDAVRETLLAFVEETNGGGGIYGRSLRLDVFSPEEWSGIAGSSALASQYFCVLGPYGRLAVAPRDLPVLGVLEPDPLVDPSAEANVFHLYPSQLSQLRVAVDHYCEVLKHEKALFRLVLEDDEALSPILDALTEQVRLYDGAQLACGPLDPETEPETEVPSVLLLAGSPEHKLRALSTLGSRDHVSAIYSTHRLPPGAVTKLAPETLAKLRLLLPIALPEATDPRLLAFRQFLARHGLPETQISHRIASFAAVAAFAECLKRCGQRVTRQKLVREMSSLYKFRPGLFPPLSYDANRKVGARGAQVVRFDPDTGSLVPLSDWSEPR